MTLPSKICLILAFPFAFATLPADGPEPPPAKTVLPTKLSLSRSRVVQGDRHRSKLVIWDVGGRLPMFGPQGFAEQPVYTVDTVEVTRQPTSKWGENWYDPTFHGTFTVPTLAPGTYTLTAGSLTAEIAVVAAPKPQPAVYLNPPTASVSPRDTTREINDAIAKGKPIVLKPGEYVLDGPLNPSGKAGVSIRGYGAILRWPAALEWAIGVGDDMTLEGLTLDAPGQFTLSNFNARGLVLYRCKTLSGGLWHGGSEIHVEECEFNGSCVNASQGTWVNNIFRGGRTGHAFTQSGKNGSGSAILDNTWDDSDRGPVFNAWDAPYRGSLFLGTRLKNIGRGGHVGSETFLCEAGPFSGNVILHTLATGCIGSVCQWDRGGSGNVVRDLKQPFGYGWGVYLLAGQDCEFEDVDVPAIRLGPDTARLRFRYTTAGTVEDEGTGNTISPK